MKFGENLKLIRKSKKISQEDLADRLGVSRQSVSKWETGENYPTMTNIFCLCDIFKCKVNELVHEDFTDINSLDEDIKMSAVKFKEKEQKRMKGLSKVIYIAARILKIISFVGMVGVIIALLSSFVVVPNTKFDTTEKKITVFNNEFRYNYNNDHLVIEGEKVVINNNKIVEIESFLSKSNFYKISFIVIMFTTLAFTCFCLFKMLDYLEKVFVNIHDNDTPFSSDNVNYIRNIANYLALHVLVPDISGLLSSLIFKVNLGVDFELVNYLFVLVVLTISYVFKYGYEIQLDSKGRIYGDINE